VRRKKRELKPLTAYRKDIVFDGANLLKCKTCGASHIMCPPSYPSSPRDQFHWTQAFNAEIGNFFSSHELCKEI
jgi:hypothetical protein